MQIFHDGKRNGTKMKLKEKLPIIQKEKKA